MVRIGSEPQDGQGAGVASNDSATLEVPEQTDPAQKMRLEVVRQVSDQRRALGHVETSACSTQ